MRDLSRLLNHGRVFAIVIAIYVLCHGTVALVITPIQSYYLPEVSIFASLVYLPHGVRVLATWLLGLRAVVPLFIGNLAASFLFRSDAEWQLLEPALMNSMLVSALGAYMVFEVFRLFGKNLYTSGTDVSVKDAWKWLLLVGVLSSVLNSLGQSIVFSGFIDPESVLTVSTIYAVGDLVGLSLSMIILMFIFRWLRLQQKRGG